jgi:hypothetical protein
MPDGTNPYAGVDVPIERGKKERNNVGATLTHHPNTLLERTDQHTA